MLKNENVSWNAMEFLKMIRSAVQQSIGIQNDSSYAIEIIEETEVISSLWLSASQTQVQFRAVSQIRKLHEFLLEKSVPEDRIPIPDWLKTSIQKLEKRDGD